MKIGVISDTHDRLPTLDRGLELLIGRGVEVIVHPGDIVAPFAAKRLLSWRGPLYVTYGNNDGERKGLRAILPQIQDGPVWVDAGGRRLLLHHALEWCDPADVARADIVVTGHTHAVDMQSRDGKLFLNAGVCCGWVTGRCTVAVIVTDSLSAEIVEVPL